MSGPSADPTPTPASYPALIDLTAGRAVELAGLDELVIGRSQQADLCVTDPAVSRRQARLIKTRKGFELEPISKTVPTRIQTAEITKRTRLQHGQVISFGSDVQLQYADSPAELPAVETYPDTPLPDTPSDATAHPAGPATASPDTRALHPAATQAGHTLTNTPGAPAGRRSAEPPPLAPKPVALTDRLVLGREADAVDVHLDHPTISRRHAVIETTKRGVTLADLNSANGTFLNGTRVTTATPLHEGDRLDLGPFALTFTGSALVPQAVRANNVELHCRSLTRVVKDRTTGKPLTLLDNVSVALQPRDFACLLGPSGSGKSTLLNAMAARVPADDGRVTLNGEDLYANFDALKTQIAVVPQKDVLHDALPVGKALRYTAELRLPPDTTGIDLDRAVDEMLDTVGLTHRKTTNIADLSGGQIKRASLANEIIAKPSLLFLDEVTSGLDEQTDREMMQLFRQIADQGKTVVCITHSLANVEENCTLVVILTPGGKLAFVGPPDNALTYFKIDRLGDVYQRLAERDADDWRDAFLKHPLHDRYITQRLPEADDADTAPPPRKPPRFSETLRTAQRQLPIMLRRYVDIFAKDRRSLAFVAAQSLLVAILLCVLYSDVSDRGAIRDDFDPDEFQPAAGLDDADSITVTDFSIGQQIPWQMQQPLNDELQSNIKQKVDRVTKTAEDRFIDRVGAGKTGQLLFLLSVTCFWFGVNNAAKEIVKERLIIDRERDVNLLAPAYYASKFALLSTLTILQALALFLIVKLVTGFEGGWILQMLSLALLATAGVALGLLISSLAKSTDMAVTLVPIAVIPQIVLAGIVAQLDGLADVFAMLTITCYWGWGTLAGDLPYRMARVLDRHTWTPWLTVWLIAVHTLIFTAAGLAALMLSGDKQNRTGAALNAWITTARKRIRKSD
ncbi:MAG: FHA domain-containing protein [Planctomycetota bacterium]